MGNTYNNIAFQSKSVRNFFAFSAHECTTPTLRREKRAAAGKWGWLGLAGLEEGECIAVAAPTFAATANSIIKREATHKTH